MKIRALSFILLSTLSLSTTFANAADGDAPKKQLLMEAPFTLKEKLSTQPVR